jgi:hypothetical protein
MALNSKYGRKRKLQTKSYANKKKGESPKSIFKTNAISQGIFISQPLGKLEATGICMVVVKIIRMCHKQV